MATLELPRSALRYKTLSAAAAARAVREASKVSGRAALVANVVTQHQAAQVRLAETATALMLSEQGITTEPVAPLNAAAFTTSAGNLAGMLAQVDTTSAFTQLVASLVQDAGRSAQSVAQTSRPRVGWTRVLTPPSCVRCAVLAGRVYRYSDGFLRHPRDDCTTIPVSEGDRSFVSRPVDLARAGMVRGLSKDDMKAINDGADINHVVDVQSSNAGLTEPGRALARPNRLTPEGIYRVSSDRDQALELLTRYRYLAA